MSKIFKNKKARNIHKLSLKLAKHSKKLIFSILYSDTPELYANLEFDSVRFISIRFDSKNSTEQNRNFVIFLNF